MITRELLRSLRNDLPMAVTLALLGPDAPCSKTAEGRLRFVCPRCGEFLAAINPHNNLAHCFACGVNINNIDLLLAAGYDFRAAVSRLEKWLLRHKTGAVTAASSRKTPPPAAPVANPNTAPTPIAALLQAELRSAQTRPRSR